jgi:hypothetical protein
MKEKHVRLTPELQRKYREWLRSQGNKGLSFNIGEEGEPNAGRVSEAELAGIERWMQEANIAAVEFDEDGGEEEDEAPAAPSAERPTSDLNCVATRCPN